MNSQCSTEADETAFDCINQTTVHHTEEERSEDERMKALKTLPVTREKQQSEQATRERRSNASALRHPEIPHAAAETTDLDRRVLAHERILQALIAHMTETEPKFLIRLSERFSEPMRMVRNEHDYKDTDSYAEEFIRAVIRLGERSARKPVPPADSQAAKSRVAAQGSPDYQPLSAAPRTQVREQSGVWEVLVDGQFYGQYLKQEHALAAAKALN